MDEGIVAIIVAVIGLVGTYLGAKYGKQYQAVKSKVIQVADILDVVNEAAKDDKVTEEEFQAIMDAAMKLKEA